MGNAVFVSTELVDAEERCDFWREATRPVFDTVPLPGDLSRSLEGSIRSRPIGGLLAGTISFNGQRYNRDRRTVVQSGLDNYMIQILTSGTLRGDFNGVDVSAGPGDIAILDLTQTLKSEVDAGTRISFAVPRAQLERMVGARNLHGAVLRAEWPITRLVIVYLSGLWSVGGQLSARQAAGVQESVVTLLGTALNGEMPDGAAEHSALAAALRSRVLAFIEQNIHLRELSPDVIARRFNVSRSHLYRAFASDGGVATVLREKRLDRAFQELVGPAPAPRSIAEIAHRLGFSSGNQFLRAFRSRFGMTPSEVRENEAGSWGVDQPIADLQSYFAGLRDRAAKP